MVYKNYLNLYIFENLYIYIYKNNLGICYVSILEMVGNPKTPKNPKIIKNFNCECCKYITVCKGDFEKHLKTAKHKKNTQETINEDFGNDGNPKTPKTPNNLTNYNCECCKRKFKTNSGLWKHKKTCINENDKVQTCVEIVEQKPNTDTNYKDIIMTLVNENKEMRNMMSEQQKTITEMMPHMGNNTTNNNTINNNQKFNINVFLNEKCKDAINMSDFIKSIEVSVEQLQYTTNNGLEKGISQVIMDNMNKLSLYERPVHCTDTKRETIYIKDNDKWEKDKDKTVLKKAINKASNKNYTALTEWTKDNPNFMKCDDKQMFYAKTISAIGKPIDNVNDKIVKKICSNTSMKGSLENHD